MAPQDHIVSSLMIGWPSEGIDIRMNYILTQKELNLS